MWAVGVDGIIRRLDRTGDGMVSYSEFVDGVMPSESYFILEAVKQWEQVESFSPAYRESPVHESSPLR